MKILIASILAVSLLGATAAAAADVSVRVQSGPVGAHAQTGGRDYRQPQRRYNQRQRYRRHYRRCTAWGTRWRDHHRERYCRRTTTTWRWVWR